MIGKPICVRCGQRYEHPTLSEPSVDLPAPHVCPPGAVGSDWKPRPQNLMEPTAWMVPQELTDVLQSLCPGPADANFRLGVRMAFHQIVSWYATGVLKIPCRTVAQCAAVDRAAELLAEALKTGGAPREKAPGSAPPRESAGEK